MIWLFVKLSRNVSGFGIKDRLAWAAQTLVLAVAIAAIAPVTAFAQDTGSSAGQRAFDPLPTNDNQGGQGQGDGRSMTQPQATGGDISAGVPAARQQDIPRALGDPSQERRGDSDGSDDNQFGTPPEELDPFGSQLFTNRTPVDRKISVNPTYKIKPGDQVAVRMWGALNFDQVLSVDQQGNIFLPEVGPVMLEGVPSGELNARVRSAVRNVYTEDVGIYTNLLGTQPIGVYVTGTVEAPGHYPGSRNETLLYYLARAGGVDPARGSYRRINVRRDGETIAQADLYDFLTDGDLPNVSFRDDDTIVVGQRRNSFTVSGAVRNAYRFEMSQPTVPGSRVLELSAPEATASYALVQGIRNGEDFSTYLPLKQFADFTVHDGDNIVMNSDNPPQEMLVSVVGNSGGPSSYTLPRGTKLGTFAQLVQVNPNVAKLEAMYLRRDSVAQRQKQAIERALYELQKTVLTTPSISTSESQIRSQEAELVQQFVEQARALEPEGRVVLANAQNWRDVRLEDGDELVIPNQTDIVLISGEVEVPQTVIYHEDFSVADYVDEAGGVTKRGDADNVIVVRANGRVHDGSEPIRPGDHLMVLPGEASKLFAVAKDVVEVIFRSALSTATVINASSR